MIRQRLERLKKLCGLELEKNHKFTMKEWMSADQGSLGVNCQTAGCLASIMSFDPFFEKLRFKMAIVNEEKSLTPEMRIYVPVFDSGPPANIVSQGMRALRIMFGLNSSQTDFIFGAHNPNSLAAAVCRIDAVLDGKIYFTNKDLGEYNDNQYYA